MRPNVLSQRCSLPASPRIVCGANAAARCLLSWPVTVWGEFTALVAAGCLEFASAVALVKFRAEAMQSAVPQGTGAMAAILGMEDADVVSVCAEVTDGGIVEAVNFNAPGQVVIAGNTRTVELAMAALIAKGARRALPLPVSVPAHSSLMQPAAEKLRARLVDTVVARAVGTVCTAWTSRCMEHRMRSAPASSSSCTHRFIGPRRCAR